ncbi:hypothetical protein LX36DRAFT_248834 [Colletotrichum falcatum]|nr:hypothetical protein LX36DRAFT_248834 [Colletotrichum falcatum]
MLLALAQTEQTRRRRGYCPRFPMLYSGVYVGGSGGIGGGRGFWVGEKPKESNRVVTGKLGSGRYRGARPGAGRPCRLQYRQVRGWVRPSSLSLSLSLSSSSSRWCASLWWLQCGQRAAISGRRSQRVSGYWRGEVEGGRRDMMLGSGEEEVADVKSVRKGRCGYSGPFA